MKVRETVLRVRAGDTDAFSDIVRAYQALIRGYISMYVLDPEDVLDLAQETFLTAYERLDTYDTAKDFVPWIRGIARNLTLKYLRDTGRRRRRESDIIRETIRKRAGEQLAQGAEESHFGLRELMVCLEKLKKRKDSAYRLIQMRYFENMSSKQIADSVGRREGTVRMMLLRVRQLLRDCIAKSLGERELKA
jgi:RNA polymerase sigma-70 factor (ECF subfamily)